MIKLTPNQAKIEQGDVLTFAGDPKTYVAIAPIDAGNKAWDAYFKALVGGTHTTEQVTALYKAAEAIKPMKASRAAASRYYNRQARW
jgi:hypothetical protein